MGNYLANVLNFLNNKKFYQFISLKSYEPAVISIFAGNISSEKTALKAFLIVKNIDCLGENLVDINGNLLFIATYKCQKMIV